LHQKADAAWLAFVATYVLLDTNQWDRMPALRHRLAAALLYALQARDDTVIGLPTVVREEVGLHLVEKHDKALRQVDRCLGEVRQIIGSAVHVDRASDDDVREAFDARLDELHDVVEEVTVLDDDLAAAGRMVLAYEPPNTRESQQYRDCVLWQTALRLAEDYDVIIVTNDSGFYADEASNELSPNPSRQPRTCPGH
jgi:adenosyl cobinamide kinase/adenosyl cobinamide phosphate guanylyltransferase